MPAMYKVRPLHSAGVLPGHLPTCMYPLPNLHRAADTASPPPQVGARGGREDPLRPRPAVLALAGSAMRPPGRCSLWWEPQLLLGTGRSLRCRRDHGAESHRLSPQEGPWLRLAVRGSSEG